MAKEVWKPVPGYEGRFEVSNQGRVRRPARIDIVRSRYDSTKTIARRMPEKILKTSLVGGGIHGGAHHLYLPNPGGGVGKDKPSATPFFVSTLVARVFLPPPVGIHKPQVIHKNGNRHDNRASNLKWGTRSEACRAAFLSAPQFKRKTCLSIKQVREIKQTLKAIPVDFKPRRVRCVIYRELAGRYKISTDAVRMTHTGKQWGWV